MELTLVQEQTADDLITIGIFIEPIVDASIESYIVAINDRNDDFVFDPDVYIETKTETGYKRYYEAADGDDIGLTIHVTALTVNEINSPV